MAADDSDDWVLIDDTEQEEPKQSWTGASWGSPEGSIPTSEEQPKAQGWDSFSSANSWDAMRASTPAGTSGWGVPEAEPAGNAPSEGAAQTQWFTANDLGDDIPDDAFADDGDGDAPAARDFGTLRGRLNPFSGELPAGPGFVTLVVSCLSVLLVVASVVWHPHAP